MLCVCVCARVLYFELCVNEFMCNEEKMEGVEEKR